MSRLVYSTEKGRLCPDCGEAKNACRCAEAAAAVPEGDGIVRIHRETKGRKGKGVSIVTGIPLPEKDLKPLAKKLKAKLSTGGAIKGADLEFQGDHRQTLKTLLEAEGFTVKLAGG